MADIVAWINQESNDERNTSHQMNLPDDMKDSAFLFHLLLDIRWIAVKEHHRMAMLDKRRNAILQTADARAGLIDATCHTANGCDG